MLYSPLLALMWLALLSDSAPASVEPLAGPDGRAASILFTEHLMNESMTLIDRRRVAFEQIRSSEDALAWQTARRTFMIEQIGGIPEPIRPASRTVGIIDRGDYVVEKVIYESRPGHHITAVLYLPKNQKPPFPAMIICCGHSYDGKASEGYQRVGILAAKNGLAALCFDPIGQGERYQILNVKGRSGHHTSDRPNPRLVEIQKLTPSAPPQYNPVEEHTLIGIGPILLGSNTAHYRVWDAMRSVDYLVSRPDIDATKIGVTGNSGGGTESSYLMALDNRVAAAAPGCFLTSYQRLLETVGPQDAEQNVFGQLKFGLDESDYVIMTAPRPVSILAATRDATFDIGGTWDLFREAKRFYGKLGYPERADLVETDDVHGFTIHLREGAVRWMRRWMMNIDDSIFERDFPVFQPAELQCTPQGQVLLMEGERSVFDLSRETADQLAAKRRQLRTTMSSDEMRDRVARLAGISLSNLSSVKTTKPVVSAPEGLANATWLELPERVPLLIRTEKPAKENGQTIVYAPEDGVAGIGRDVEPLKSWLQDGFTVTMVDLTGLGATQPAQERHWSGELFGPGVRQFFLAYLNGRSIVGIRTEDLLAIGDYLRKQNPASPLHLHARGATAIPALHAAALRPDQFASLTLENCVPTWHDVVNTPVPENQLVNTVHGALAVYDLPDLVELAGGADRVKLIRYPN